MKLELMKQIVREVLGPPEIKITMKDVEAGVRHVFRNDPLRAERAVGQMYGNYFKKTEEKYDAAQAVKAERKNWK